MALNFIHAQNKTHFITKRKVVPVFTLMQCSVSLHRCRAPLHPDGPVGFRLITSILILNHFQFFRMKHAANRSPQMFVKKKSIMWRLFRNLDPTQTNPPRLESYQMGIGQS